MTRKKINSEAELLAIFLVASILQSYYMCPTCDSVKEYGQLTFFIFTLWTSLWYGNNALNHFLNARLPWIEFPLRRFVVGLSGTLAMTLVVVYLVVFLFDTFLGFNFGNSLRPTIIVSIIITLIVTFFMDSREFLMHWRKAAVDIERLERERIASLYESLKNRVNPLFLFNSLQTLRKLVPEDKDQAAKFIKNLSDVYRNILDSRDKELVDFKEEKRYFRSFIFLMQARFGNAIVVNTEIPETDFYISPLTLQLIFESLATNTSFNDQISLHFTITKDAASLMVSARFNQWLSEEHRNQVEGVLKRIEERYALLTDKPVSYEFDADRFFSSIPVLHTTLNENRNYAS